MVRGGVGAGGLNPRATNPRGNLQGTWRTLFGPQGVSPPHPCPMLPPASSAMSECVRVQAHAFEHV